MDGKKAKKIVLAVFLAALLIHFSLVSDASAGGGKSRGGGTEVSPSGRPEIINVLLSPPETGTSLEKSASGFSRATGVEVNLIVESREAAMNRQVFSLTARSSAYDVVSCTAAVLPEYAAKGLVDDLEDLLPSSLRDGYVDGMLDAVTDRGRVYALPLAASWTVMAFNARLLGEIGPDPNKVPKTWAELLRIGRLLKAKGYIALAEPLAPGEPVAEAFFRWAKSAGAKVWEWRGDKVYWLLDSPECLAAVRFVKKLLYEGVMEPGAPTRNGEESLELFQRGQAVILLGGGMLSRGTPVQPALGVAAMPGNREGMSGSSERHEYLAVPSASEHKKAARDFILYVTSPEVSRLRAIEDGALPAYRALYEDPDVRKRIPADAILGSAAYCYYRPFITRYAEITGIVSTAVQDILVNEKDPPGALAEANRGANALCGW